MKAAERLITAEKILQKYLETYMTGELIITDQMMVNLYHIWIKHL